MHNALTKSSGDPAGGARDVSRPGWFSALPRKLAASYLPDLLTNRAFTLVFAGQTVSQVGNGAYQVALAWTVYSISGSARDMGAVLAVNVAAKLLFFLIGGALADRISRRVVILTSDLACGAITLSLVILADMHGLTVGELLFASASLGIFGALYGPAYRAIVSDIVTRERYSAANSFLAFGASMARILGPVCGGLLYAAGGAPLAFAFDAGTFAAAVVAMLLTPFPRSRVIYQGGLWGDVASGVKFCLRTRWLLGTTALSLVANVLGTTPYLVLIPVVVRMDGGGAGELGLITAIQVISSSLTSLWLARWSQVRRPMMTLLALASCFGLGMVIIGLARSTVVVAAGALVLGIGFGVDIVEANLTQSRVPRSMISKAFSFNLLVSFGAAPIGYVMAGWLQGVLGTSRVLLVGGASLLACIAAAAACLMFLNISARSRIARERTVPGD